ncbi:MAG: AroM family protein [Candidatus Bathyarchaeota archaeon]|nr:MAG: AroM family protein [Candidatus Bathyarchaeota archaeon]
MKKIGMLTIGQSPRDDILPLLKEILGEGFEILEAGALDDLSKEDLDRIEFKPDDYLLISRMRDGTQVKITKRLILPLLQKRIHELEGKGVRLTVIMCTGKFPQFESKGLVVTPQEILKGVLKASLKRGKLAVVYPAQEQTRMASEFSREGVTIYSDHLSPYKGKDDLEQLAARLSMEDPDLILLNCFGFGSDVKKVVAERTGRPVIQSNTLVAKVLKELAS